MEQKPLVTLVATDLDGTLLNSHKQVSEATRQCMKELKNRGIMFGIASGRPVESTRILVKEWGLEPDVSFLIGMNGGVIYDMRTGEKDAWHLMKGETILEIMDHFQDLPVIFQVLIGNDRYVSESNEQTRAHAKLFGENEKQVDLSEFLKGKMVNKLILYLDPKDMDKIKERAATFSSPEYTSMQTGENLYEYQDPNVNKGFGIEKVCEHFGISPEHVVAFGDNENDREMLEFVGTGVAMANAADNVKAHADYVSPYTNDEDALAVFVMEDILPNNEHCLEKNANVKV